MIQSYLLSISRASLAQLKSSQLTSCGYTAIVHFHYLHPIRRLLHFSTSRIFGIHTQLLGNHFGRTKSLNYTNVYSNKRHPSLRHCNEVPTATAAKASTPTSEQLDRYLSTVPSPPKTHPATASPPQNQTTHSPPNPQIDPPPCNSQ